MTDKTHEVLWALEEWAVDITHSVQSIDAVYAVSLERLLTKLRATLAALAAQEREEPVRCTCREFGYVNCPDPVCPIHGAKPAAPAKGHTRARREDGTCDCDDCRAERGEAPAKGPVFHRYRPHSGSRMVSVEEGYLGADVYLSEGEVLSAPAADVDALRKDRDEAQNRANHYRSLADGYKESDDYHKKEAEKYEKYFHESEEANKALRAEIALLRPTAGGAT